MNRCFIFGALPVDRLPERPQEGDLVIAADRGYAVTRSLGITPDLIVGDFDSLGEAPPHSNVICLNVRKDDTDLEHAVNVALEHGYNDFVVYGAVGGQLDHTLGNVAVAERIADRGGRAVFYGAEHSFTVIRNASFRLKAREEGRVSVFSLRDVSQGVAVRGLSYEAEYIDLPRATTRGVGNLFVGRDAEISVKDGTLLIVWEENESVNDK